MILYKWRLYCRLQFFEDIRKFRQNKILNLLRLVPITWRGSHSAQSNHIMGIIYTASIDCTLWSITGVNGFEFWDRPTCILMKYNFYYLLPKYNVIAYFIIKYTYKYKELNITLCTYTQPFQYGAICSHD